MEDYHLYDEVGRGKDSVVYKGRKKQTIEFVALRSYPLDAHPLVRLQFHLLSLFLIHATDSTRSGTCAPPQPRQYREVP